MRALPKLSPSVSSCFSLALASAVAVTAIGCGGPPKVQSASGERLPANGAAGATASELPSKSIARDDWAKITAEGLKPTCDARPGSRGADAPKLESAGKIIGTWTEFSTKKAKSRTADGKKVGGGPEPTRMVDSLGMTCAGDKSSIQVNGTLYPFDVAWVASGDGSAPTLSGQDGAGQFAMIQALSFKDKRVIFAKVYVPSDANDDTDDTVVIGNLANAMPANAGEPIVRAVSDRKNPLFETFVPVKGSTEGISFQAPNQDGLGRARYVSIAKFNVAR